jgi:hypothetical protein
MERILKSKLATCILILVLVSTIFVFAGDVIVKQGDLDVAGNLDVAGDLNADSDLNVAGELSVADDLSVGGDLTVDGKITGPTGGGYPNAYINYLFVDYYAEFYQGFSANYIQSSSLYASYISCNKLHANIVDPAGVLYDLQRRQEIIDAIKNTVPPNKQSGALMFFNKDTKELETYVPGEGKFYDIQGNLLYTMPTPEVATNYKTIYYLDIMTGEVKSRQEVLSDRYVIKKGYRLDSKTGHFINTASGEIVPKETAIELKKAS